MPPLRVKLNSTRGKVDVDSSTSLQELRVLAASALGFDDPASVTGLSLNGREWTDSFSDAVPCLSLFCPGDLIHIRAEGTPTGPPTGTTPAAPAQQAQAAPMVVSQVQAEAPRPGPGGSGALDDSGAAGPSDAATAGTDPSDFDAEHPPHGPSLPAKLQEVVASQAWPSLAPSSEDVLFALLHAAMLDSGFEAAGGEGAVAAARLSVCRYAAEYVMRPAVAMEEASPTLAPSPSYSARCTLRLSFIGPHAVVAASSAKSQPEIVRAKLNLPDHVAAPSSAPPTSLEPTSLFPQPWASWALVKDTVARPIQIMLLAEMGLEPGAHLLALPFEVRMLILERLSVPDLASLSQACRELRGNCEDDSLWLAHFQRDFPALHSSPAVQAAARARGWRAVYRDRWRERTALERARREAARLMFTPPVQPPTRLYVPPQFPQFPGIVGGDYDRLPPGMGPGIGFGRGYFGPGGPGVPGLLGAGGPGMTLGPMGIRGGPPTGPPGTGLGPDPRIGGRGGGLGPGGSRFGMI